MKEYALKESFSLFGKFGFSATPKVSISLLKAFSDFNVMPTMVQYLDPSSGLKHTSIGLQNEDGLQIVCGENRIDIVRSGKPKRSNDVSFEAFVLEILANIPDLSNSTEKINRVAIVNELLLSEISQENLIKFSDKYIPSAETSSSEWSIRYVTKMKLDNEDLNICSEVNRINGMLINKDEVEAFDGLRLFVEVNTLQEQSTPRFSKENLKDFLPKLTQIHLKQIAKLEPVNKFV